uniref:Oxidoreductase n=1 Tax=Chromera velia CCMP2878 TaxID=1169474 RepID=A0A0G4I910_9ALVE|mmetsp:Transcript_17755/g.36065  ORF Transcript_17755/g.36065 Transcript_17755/m.36065 type:complete len:255 (-) Transcript_17755:195-959(-)|eukprot:Cvel_12042.t1-p1 / transcript=Cvel_12042.t1 / gene=Cvel_12042 / organism=Chromera_velia_CCMP2878 / gene_product=Uncharacterized oxidoreductase TM_0019, putative / transcript_product=Uncharacterized oxidoreductase TM_0019, putative / location=Cvel_scaffold773:64208-65761(-) / protein_length=254 / sequence_SO=supercontig / SO=protein_coding / is_pseudo=false
MVRHAIVTGCGRAAGIGSSVVKKLAAHGWHISCCDVSCEPAFQQSLTSLGTSVVSFYPVDLTDSSAVSSFVQKAVEAFGPVHLLVNNAAVSNPYLQVEDPANTSILTEFQRVLSINLVAPFNLSRLVLPHMPDGDAAIVHVASTRARQSEPDSEAYAASKGGLCALAHAQAASLGPRKIRVNAILPGWIDTSTAGPTALRKEDHAWHSVGRVGLPDDVAEAVLFLADGRRSGFITGQDLVVDGGVSTRMRYPEE